MFRLSRHLMHGGFARVQQQNPLTLRWLAAKERVTRLPVIGPCVAYIMDNFGGLMAYQLVMEGLVTSYFFAGLQSGNFSAEGLRVLFEDKLSISIIDFKGSMWDRDLQLGVKTINQSTLTNVTTAHNVAVGLLPLQMLVILVTYPLVHKTWSSRCYPVLQRVPVVNRLLKKPMMPNEFADKVMPASAAERKMAASQSISNSNRKTKLPFHQR